MRHSLLQTLAVGGWRRLAAVGGPGGLSSGAVLNKRKIWILKDGPASGEGIGEVYVSAWAILQQRNNM